MKYLLLLLSIFFNSAVYSQNNKAEEIRLSLLQNNETTLHLQYLLSELEFIKCRDSSPHFAKIKDFIRENIIENDTLFIYTQGIMGNNSPRGRGDYDSLTLPYSFLYYDIYTSCIMEGCFFDGMQMYNKMIEKEIARRHGRKWKANIQKKIDKINPTTFEEEITTNKLKFSFKIKNRDIKVIKIKKIYKLETYFANLKSVNSELNSGNNSNVITASIWFFEGDTIKEMFYDVQLHNITGVVQRILARNGKVITLINISFSVQEWNEWDNLGSYHFKVK